MSEKPRHDTILSNAIMDALGAALGIDIGKAHRIVLDVQVNRPVSVYVQFFGDTRMLAMELPQMTDADLIRITTANMAVPEEGAL